MVKQSKFGEILEITKKIPSVEIHGHFVGVEISGYDWPNWKSGLYTAKVIFIDWLAIN